MELNSYTTSPFIPEGVLRQKYLADRLSMLEIAEEFSCSKTRIRDLLLKYKISLRKRLDCYGSRRPDYGKRKVGGKVINHKGEMRTIATIKQMYGEGVSAAAIARFLNTMKIPTRQQGKCWSDYMIIVMLKREGIYVEGRRAGGKG